MNIHAKLMKARLMLQNTPLKKSGHNKFAGYYYFELGDFLPTVQEIFSELSMCGIVSYTADTATLQIVDTEDSSMIQITSPMGSAALKGCHEVQNIGACETYQRRYLWVTAMEIVEHDALDSAPPVEVSAPAKPQKADKPPKLFSPPLATDSYMVDSTRADIIFAAAKSAVGHHVAGDDASAWDEVSGITDNDEKQYLWAIIKDYSALRAALKKFATQPKEEANA